MARFTAQISEWTKKTEGALEQVVRQASMRVFEEMTRPQDGGGNMPVDTGYLRSSVRASLRAMPRILSSREGKEGQFYSPSGQVEATIATLPLGKPLYLGFQAAYAARENYGSKKHKGHLFVEQAAQKWGQIVKEAEAEVAANLGVK